MFVDVIAGEPADLTVITDEDGVVVAAGFREPERLAEHAGISEPLQPQELVDIRQAWREYLAGDFDALAQVPVQQHGSSVQEEVWQELGNVPAGQPASYSEVAELIGRPKAARAVGSACGANRVAPFVPCHRVVAADGSLGGYGYGLDVKSWLLRHEAAADR